MTPHRRRYAFAGLLLVAFLLRAIHIATIRDYPLFDVLPLDSESYDRWARAILAGEWRRGAPFYQAPLYAYFLAGLHAISGGELLFPRVVNALLGTVTVGLVGLLTRRVFGWPAAFVAAGLVALHGTLWFEEGKVMKTTLGVTLTALTLLGAVESGRRKSWALAAGVGFVAGLASLVRENFLLFALALAALRLARRRPAEGVAVVVGVTLAILPATLHNLSYDGEFLPITSQAGQNFYTGVHPGNDDGGYLVPDFVRRSPRFEEIDFAAEAERRVRGDLTPGRISAYWRDEGLRVLADDPGRALRLVFVKWGLLFHDFEIPDDEDLRYFKRFAPMLRWPWPGFGVFLVLGTLGLVLAVARRRAPPELLLFLGVYATSVAMFFVFSRYRLPLVPVLAPFAGHGVLEVMRAARARDLRPVALAALAALVVGAVAYRPLDVPTVANSHLSTGIALEVGDEPAEAYREYRRGLALEPNHPKLLRRAAILAWDAAVAAGTTRPDSTLVDLVTRAFEANSSDTSLLARYGAALAGQGKLDEAAACFEALVREGEEPDGIYLNLALIYEALEKPELALIHAERAAVRRPGDGFTANVVTRLRATIAGEDGPRP